VKLPEPSTSTMPGRTVIATAPVPTDSASVAGDPLEAQLECADEPIPVLRPLLPSAGRLLPYLERIDVARIYSNWGPLVMELSERLSATFNLAQGSVVCANSGMSALVGAILATAGSATATRPLAVVPDFTFTATALAAQMCGYEVVLAGCRPDTWTFTPEDLLANPDLLSRVGLVVPVAPFGRPVDQVAWHHFQETTNIAVVIDGAACFESFAMEPRRGAGPLPVALSFHATKSFGVGEGGCVVTTDADVATRVFRCLNFGFLSSRTTLGPSINGKMSEYSAAVGLAELDEWDDKQRRMSSVFDNFRVATGAPLEDIALVGWPDISSCYVLLRCDSPSQADRAVSALSRRNIDTRLWYGAGLGEHENFKRAARIKLKGAELDPRTLVGLPTAPDLTVDQIERIVNCIRRSFAESRT
jgi:dTDP-4-amino-4,6-dideoxygalactose transaminase